MKTWTPERRALARSMRGIGKSSRDIYAALNALPGPRISSIDSMTSRMHALGIRALHPDYAKRDENIRALNAEGIGPTEIGRRLGISYETVRDRMRAMGLRTLKRQIVKATDTPEWPAAKREQFRALWDEGLSASQIGVRLGATKNAVIGIRNRMGLPARPSPIPSIEMRQSRPSAVSYRRDAQGRTLVWDNNLPRMPAEPVGPARCCQWPLWADGERPGKFCEVPSVKGSYCRKHARMAYRPAGAAPNEWAASHIATRIAPLPSESVAEIA